MVKKAGREKEFCIESSATSCEELGNPVHYGTAEILRINKIPYSRRCATVLKKEDYDFYLDLRKYGSARHAGFGLGFERCVMYLTGMSNIRDVIPFPRTPKNAEY